MTEKAKWMSFTDLDRRTIWQLEKSRSVRGLSETQEQLKSLAMYIGEEPRLTAADEMLLGYIVLAASWLSAMQHNSTMGSISSSLFRPLPDGRVRSERIPTL